MLVCLLEDAVRQRCIVSSKRAPRDSYKYDSRRSFPSHQVILSKCLFHLEKGTHLVMPLEVRVIITLCFSCSAGLLCICGNECLQTQTSYSKFIFLTGLLNSKIFFFLHKQRWKHMLCSVLYCRTVGLFQCNAESKIFELL